MEEEVSGQRSKVIREEYEEDAIFTICYLRSTILHLSASAPLTSLHYVHANRLR